MGFLSKLFGGGKSDAGGAKEGDAVEYKGFEITPAARPQNGQWLTAGIIRKVLESAIANAENNDGADVDELKVAAIYVDEGPTMKRIRPRAKGRADRILKRTSHITIKVSDGRAVAGKA